MIELPSNFWCAGVRCATIALLLGSGLLAMAADENDKEVQMQVDERSSLETKMEYLRSVISQSEKASDAAATRKAFAIALLGKLAGTNAIATLVTNIDFVDKRTHTSPAVEALAKIGEPAIPELLRALEEYPERPRQRSPELKLPGTNGPHSSSRTYPPPEEIRILFIVEAICAIKGRTYQQFLDEQKGHVSEKVWSRLNKYRSTFSL
jgi:hypothetical protein